MAMMEQKYLETLLIEDDWVGPYDYEPSCLYNECVGCPSSPRDCANCGWNPFVAAYRIKTKYGSEAIDNLSFFGQG